MSDSLTVEGTAPGRLGAERRVDERPLVRHRRLPGGRAVVGGLLIAIAAVAIFAAYLSATRQPRQLYVVAARQIPIGARLKAGDLRLVPLALPDAGVRAEVFGAVGPLIGASTVAPIAAGSLIEAASVVGRGGEPGTREISISIDRARAVAGTLKSGEYVNVLATFGTGADAYTTVMAFHIRVITLSSLNGTLGDERTQLITFAAPTETDAEAIADASIAAQVTLERSSDVAPPAPPAESTYHPPGRVPAHGGP